MCNQGKQASCYHGNNNCVTWLHKLSASAYINCVGLGPVSDINRMPVGFKSVSVATLISEM